MRGVSDETTDDGLPPLEDLEDSEVQSKVLPLTPVRCGENARTLCDNYNAIDITVDAHAKVEQRRTTSY